MTSSWFVICLFASFGASLFLSPPAASPVVSAPATREGRSTSRRRDDRGRRDLYMDLMSSSACSPPSAPLLL
ncbi:hypothetical protein CALVIDRAFT_539843 [Calocera viscosa TUFC12733]|uniref:Secreted protein n=1 Tax=Calocera viscosa (strain TUFC12733) TaxID=1330018 RepID=A0A167JK69_CALVF|nr:hypothetical protein CALVIDRAFT_539843 [Calocera viscosa TUFC12733]